MQQPLLASPFGQAKPPQHLNLTGVSQAPSPSFTPPFAQSNQMQASQPSPTVPSMQPSQLQQQLQQLLLLQQQQQQQQQQLIQQMLPQTSLSDHDQQLLHSQQLQIQQLQQQLQMQSNQLRQPQMQQQPLSLQQLMQANHLKMQQLQADQSRVDSMQVQQQVWLPPSTPNLSSLPAFPASQATNFGLFPSALPAQEQVVIEKRKKVVAQRSSKKTAPKSTGQQLRQRDEFGHFMPNKNKLCKTEVMEIQLQAQNSDSECRALRKELSEKDSEIDQLKKKLREMQLVNQEQQHRIHSMEQQQQQSFEQLDAIRIFKQRMTYLKQLEQHFEEKRKRDEEDEERLNNPMGVTAMPNSPSFGVKSPLNTPRPYFGTPNDTVGSLTSPRRQVSSPINFPSRDGRPLHSPTKTTPVEKKEKSEPIKQPPSYWFPNVYNSSIPRQFREKIDFSKIELKPCGKPPSLVEIAISQHWESERMMKEQLDLVAKQIQTNHIHHHMPSTRNIGNPEAFSQKIDFKEELKKLRKINSTVKKEFSEWLLAQPDSPAQTVPSPTLSPSPSTPNLLGTPSTPTLLMSALTVRGATPLGTPNVSLPHTPNTATLMPKGVTTRAQTNNNSQNCAPIPTNTKSEIHTSSNNNHNNNSDESTIIIKIDDEDLDESRPLKTDNNNDSVALDYKKEEDLNFDDNDNERIKDSLFGSSVNSGSSLFENSGGLFSSSSSIFHNNDNNDSANSPPAYMEVMHEDAYGQNLFIDEENRNQFDTNFILARSLSPDEKW